jgi:(p)ppGpp synthase/HD superfamily hydrolase
MAYEAHHGTRREGDTGIEHPTEVAAILGEEGFAEEIVAAGLLHDVIEDTDTDVAEIESRFGRPVADLVAAMTEDQRIDSYEERKAQHRERIAANPRAAAIYAADKLANTRWLRQTGKPVPEEKLDHYVETLRTLCDSNPELPFLAELRDELEALRRESDAA